MNIETRIRVFVVLLAVLPLCTGRSEAQQAQFDIFMAGFRDKVRSSFDIDPVEVKGDVGVFITKSLAAKLIAEAKGNAKTAAKTKAKRAIKTKSKSKPKTKPKTKSPAKRK